MYFLMRVLAFTFYFNFIDHISMVLDRLISEAEVHMLDITPQPLYNTIVGVHSINHVS